MCGVLQTQGCNSVAVRQIMYDIVREYSALSSGVSVESLIQLVSVSSHFTCNLLTTITCTYSLSGVSSSASAASYVMCVCSHA